MIERRKLFWILHYGTVRMGYYAIFRHKPDVIVRQVTDAMTHKTVPLYEANGFVFNFCETGMENWLRIKLPLGESCQLKIELFNDVP